MYPRQVRADNGVSLVLARLVNDPIDPIKVADDKVVEEQLALARDEGQRFRRTRIGAAGGNGAGEDRAGEENREAHRDRTQAKLETLGG